MGFKDKYFVNQYIEKKIFIFSRKNYLKNVSALHNEFFNCFLDDTGVR